MLRAPQSHDRGGENPPPAPRCPVPPKPSLDASPVPLRTEVHFHAGFLLYLVSVVSTSNKAVCW